MARLISGVLLRLHDDFNCHENTCFCPFHDNSFKCMKPGSDMFKLIYSLSGNWRYLHCTLIYT